MKLYEINDEISRIMLQLEPDPETGEIPMDCEELEAQLAQLSIKREQRLEYLAKVVLNIRSETAALKAEEKRLRDRRETMERKEERLMDVLDRECDGETTDLGVATFRYRKTTRLEVPDAAKAIRWLKRKKLFDCFRVPEPEVSKTNVKLLLKDGVKVPGVKLVEDRSRSLK